MAAEASRANELSLRELLEVKKKKKAEGKAELDLSPQLTRACTGKRYKKHRRDEKEQYIKSLVSSTQSSEEMEGNTN